MTEMSMPATIRLDQFVAARPAKVWRSLTEPDLMRLWWAEGAGTRVFLKRSGFDPGDERMAQAFVVPRLADASGQARPERGRSVPRRA